MTSTHKLIDIDFSKLSIQLKSRYKSSVWQHFGYLFLNEDGNSVIVSNDVYCNLCFQQNKLHCYKHSSSSSNLQRHLIISHNVDISPDSDSKNFVHSAVKLEPSYQYGYENESKTEDNSLGDPLDPGSLCTSSNRLKALLCNNLTVNLALACCKDLIPFDFVGGSGFQQFLINSGIASSFSQIPSSSAVSEEVLVNIYHSVLEAVSSSFTEAEQTLALTVEKWREKDLTYRTWRFHFSNKRFEQQTVAMPTIVGKSLSEEYADLLEEIENFCDHFKLLNRSIVMISENIPSDETTLATLNSIKVHQHYCVGHALNSLVNINGLSKVLESNSLLTNAHKILQTSNIEGGTLLLKEAYQNLDNYVKALTKCNLYDKSYISWSALITLLEHIDNECNQSSDDATAPKMKVLTEENEVELTQLLLFLKQLREAFEILNGTPYTSCALVLLLRAEMQRLLTSSDNDCKLLKTIKKAMKEALPQKFPVTELHVCASLLDPSQRGWSSVQDYLVSQHITFVDFLTLMLKKFSLMDTSEVASELKSQESDSQRNSEFKPKCLETLALKTEPPWKKVKLEILARHVTCSESSEVEREVQQYLCTFSSSGSYDDPLMWWKDQREAFPKLSRLAKIVLTIPAGCSSANDISKLTGRPKVSKLSLNGDDLIRMLFVHHNSHLIEVMS